MPVKILIAEDEILLQKILFKLLTRAGYKVVTVGNGNEAIRKIKRGHFDVLITDIRMPIKDASQTLPLIESLAPKLKIIVLTGYPLSPGMEAKVFSGRYHHISKPFDNQELLLKIKSLTARSQVA